MGQVKVMSTFWDTSSDGMGPHTKPMDLATLGEHMAQCSKSSRRWLALRCGMAALWGFVAGRPVTTGVVLGVALALLLVSL
jgi:hypothetical protein